MARLRLAVPVAAIVVVAACSAPVVRPQLAYVTARGCGEFIVYARNAERTEFLIVDVDRKKRGIGVGESRTFDIASHRDSINVRIALHAQEAFGDCNHKDRSDEKPELWRATAGAVRVALIPLAPDKPQWNGATYRAVVTLEEGLVFHGPRGSSLEMPVSKRLAADVGWWVGG